MAMLSSHLYRAFSAVYFVSVSVLKYVFEISSIYEELYWNAITIFV